MLFTLLLVFAASTLIWTISLVLRDASIADMFWGPGFVLVAAANIWWVGSLDPRGILILTIVTIWAARLTVHLFSRWRRVGHEDRRYAAMRNKAGPRFPIRSLVTVFLLQGATMWFVSLPIQTALMAPHAPVEAPALAGTLIAFAGILIEAIADRQLAQFTRNPANAGHVLDSGLWAWSRHPNYFGDAVMWWGLFIVCWAGGSSRWTILSPIVMTYILLQVSGVSLLERKIVDRRPGYTDYIRRTSAFVPLPPGMRQKL